MIRDTDRVSEREEKRFNKYRPFMDNIFRDIFCANNLYLCILKTSQPKLYTRIG